MGQRVNGSMRSWAHSSSSCIHLCILQLTEFSGELCAAHDQSNFYSHIPRAAFHFSFLIIESQSDFILLSLFIMHSMIHMCQPCTFQCIRRNLVYCRDILGVTNSVHQSAGPNYPITVHTADFFYYQFYYFPTVIF